MTTFAPVDPITITEWQDSVADAAIPRQCSFCRNDAIIRCQARTCHNFLCADCIVYYCLDFRHPCINGRQCKGGVIRCPTCAHPAAASGSHAERGDPLLTIFKRLLSLDEDDEK